MLFETFIDRMELGVIYKSNKNFNFIELGFYVGYASLIL